MTNKEITHFELPEELSKITEEFIWEDHTFGYSGTKVFKLNNNQEVRYLKINQPKSEFNLNKEKIILKWLEGKLPVPKVHYFGIKEGTEFLLLSEIPGKNSHPFTTEEAKERIIEVLAKTLKQIHEIDKNNCPLKNNPDRLLELAKQKLDDMSFNPDEFDERWQNKTPQQLYEEILKIKPDKYDLVFSHGDYCLPNIIINNNELSGLIDWSWGGINDRYFDFAAVAWSIGYNYGKEWVQLFFDKYGIEKVDWDRIKFYQMLNEFFQQ
ncbi:aminoglycoside 3'-phosphotransferase [Candidatus Heimdallarchaeota archaeon]|nr:MAG: aminoglycoside 3'-phosphotransferase [Candidatus Heimdallarchaeota archaeon]